jgi:hypothetical protein
VTRPGIEPGYRPIIKTKHGAEFHAFSSVLPQVGWHQVGTFEVRSVRPDFFGTGSSCQPAANKCGTRNGNDDLFNEKLLREIVAEEVRRVLREEWTEFGRPGGTSEYLPVAEAAARAAVAPATIRVWMAQGRLGRYHAGRELRVLSSELDALMRTPPDVLGAGKRRTPEEEADWYLQRRRNRR